MSDKMLSFVDTDKEMPAKREADARVGDFAEIYDEFDKGTAETRHHAVRSVACPSARSTARCTTTSRTG